MIDSILKLLGIGLQLWDDKEKAKYQDKFISLKEAYYAEYNKPAPDRSDAVLDNLEFELRVLIDSFTTRVGAADTPPKP